LTGLIVWKLQERQRVQRDVLISSYSIDSSSIVVKETPLQHAEKIIVESGLLYTIIAFATGLAYIANNVIYSPLSAVVSYSTPAPILSVHRALIFI
jgi:hypothetical protein